MLRFFRSKRFASLVVRIALAVGLVVALESRDLFIGGAAALIVYGLGNSLAVFATPVDYTFHATTLSVPEILDDLIEAFVQTFPILTTMGLDLRGETLKKGKKEIAHITNVPTVSSFNAGAGGYGNGAQSARSLLIDVPVTPTDHPTCPIYWEHLDQISDDKVKYDDVIRLTAYALAKDVIDKILAAVNTRNFSKEIAIAIADFDYDALGLITEKANPQKMAPTGRSLIVCSRVATVLDADPRIISKEYLGQQTGGQGIRMFKNAGGFALIQEYPEFPTNNVAQLTGVTATAATDVLAKNAHGLLTGDPVVITVIGGGAGGLAINTRYWAIRVDDNTFKLATSYANAVATTAIDVTSDSSAGHLTLGLTENLIAFAFDKRAIAVLAGIPDGFDSELMTRLRIPPTMNMEPTTNEFSNWSMAGVSWQEQGTGKLLFTPTFIWGKGLGRQGEAASNVNVMTDFAGIRIVAPGAPLAA